MFLDYPLTRPIPNSPWQIKGGGGLKYNVVVSRLLWKLTLEFCKTNLIHLEMTAVWLITNGYNYDALLPAIWRSNNCHPQQRHHPCHPQQPHHPCHPHHPRHQVTLSPHAPPAPPAPPAPQSPQLYPVTPPLLDPVTPCYTPLLPVTPILHPRFTLLHLSYNFFSPCYNQLHPVTPFYTLFWPH